MSKDLNTAEIAPDAVQNGGSTTSVLQTGPDAQSTVAANSNQLEPDAEEVAEVYFALG